MRSFIFLCSLSLLASAASAQVPAADSRNTREAGTNTHFEMPSYPTKAAWIKRKAELRVQILTAAGLDPLPPRSPLNAQVFDRIERADYAIEKVLIQTLPGYYLGGNLYSPLTPGRHPGIVSPHGHWKNGRLENTETGSMPARGINLARQGFVVFMYDMVGYNDTQQTPHAFGLQPEEQLWAFGPLGLQLWNSIRATDFLQSLPGVDPEKLAATGASGGGTQTFLLTAVDDRIRWSAPVNMVSAIMQGGSPCENAPGLRVGAFNVEIAAMMADRPMLVVSATGDWTKNVPKEEYPALRHIYSLFDKPGDVEAVQIDAPHNYNAASREAVYKFFGERILHSSTPPRDLPFDAEKPEDMLALASRKLPDGALDFDGVFALWKNQTDSTSDLERRLAATIGATWPAKVLSERKQNQIVLSRAGPGDRVPGLWFRGKGTPVLVVHPEGSAAARKSPEAQALIAAGRPVLMIDAFQTGAATAPHDTSAKYHLTFHRSDDANRIQDILTALAFLSKNGGAELQGLGKAAIWAQFAAAVSPKPVRLLSAAPQLQAEADYIRDFFVPGILRAGGSKAAAQVLAAK